MTDAPKITTDDVAPPAPAAGQPAPPPMPNIVLVGAGVLAAQAAAMGYSLTSYKRFTVDQKIALLHATALGMAAHAALVSSGKDPQMNVAVSFAKALSELVPAPPTTGG